MTFIIRTFQSHCKSEHNQVKWNKITRVMWKAGSIFYKLVHWLNNLSNLFFDNTFNKSQPGSKINTVLGYHENV